MRRIIYFSATCAWNLKDVRPLYDVHEMQCNWPDHCLLIKSKKEVNHCRCWSAWSRTKDLVGASSSLADMVKFWRQTLCPLHPDCFWLCTTQHCLGSPAQDWSTDTWDMTLSQSLDAFKPLCYHSHQCLQVYQTPGPTLSLCYLSPRTTGLSSTTSLKQTVPRRAPIRMIKNA